MVKMKKARNAAVFLSSLLYSPVRDIGVSALNVGDEVCITGYIMDNFCIDLGYMLDNPSLKTLENPQSHSFHCLLDVDACRDSGYQVLGAKDSDTGMHCLGFRFDDNDAVISAGRAAGQEGFCSTCTGDSSKPEYGYMATVKGTVKEMGDGTAGSTGTPILENVEILGDNVECDVLTIPPLCQSNGMTTSQTSNSATSNIFDAAEDAEASDSETDYTYTDLSCPDTLDSYVSFDETSVFYYALVPSDPPGARNGILCGRLEVDSECWIGFGSSINAMMIGSQAIIGFPDDNAVLKYSLGGYSTNVVTPFDESKQTLRDTSIVQEDGKTTMVFTKLLNEYDEILILEEGRNIFTWARGSSNSLDYHAAKGSFELDFSEQMTSDTDDSSSNVDAVSAPTTDVDCTKDFCESHLDDYMLQRYKINVPDGTDLQTCNGCTISMEVVYDGDAWVSIAFSEDGMMIGSEAVIGIPGENGDIPQKYLLEGKVDSLVQLMPESQQTLTDASIEVVNGQTFMKFTKIMEEEGEIKIRTGDNNFLWAYGISSTLGLHLQRGSYVQNLSTGSSEVTANLNKAAWLAHGIMAFLAWGVFVPFAVQASLFRGLLLEGPIWFHIHRAFNATSYALTVAFFAVAVAYYNKEGSPHFNGPHQKMGLAMFIIASIQVLGGLFRPHTPQEGEKKKASRSAWEIGHRVMGVILLSCGFWQMLVGVELYGQKYSVAESDQKKMIIGYAVWIGLMSFIIVIGGVYSLLRKRKDAESGSGARHDAAAKEKVDRSESQHVDPVETQHDNPGETHIS